MSIILWHLSWLIVQLFLPAPCPCPHKTPTLPQTQPARSYSKLDSFVAIICRSFHHSLTHPYSFHAHYDHSNQRHKNNDTSCCARNLNMPRGNLYFHARQYALMGLLKHCDPLFDLDQTSNTRLARDRVFAITRRGFCTQAAPRYL